MTNFEISLDRLKEVEPQDNWTEADWTHFKTIKAALEKQIPKKPIDFENEAYLCPNCLRNNFYNGTETLNKMNFCDFCGQALDWSDEERKEE